MEQGLRLSTRKSVVGLDQLNVSSQEKHCSQPKSALPKQDESSPLPPALANPCTPSRSSLLLKLSCDLPDFYTKLPRHTKDICGTFVKQLWTIDSWSLAPSFTSSLFGFVLVYKDGSKTGFFVYIFALVAVVFVDVAARLIVAYPYHLQDTNKKSSGDRRSVERKQLEDLGVSSYVGGCIAFILLLLFSPARVEHLALLFFGGLSSSVFFPCGVELKEALCRDLLSVVVLGPVTSLFCYVAACGYFSALPFTRGIPLILNAVLKIFTSEQMKEINQRSPNRKGTSASSRRRQWVYLLFILLLYVPMVWTLVLATTRSYFYFLMLLLVPLTKSLEENMGEALLGNRNSNPALSDLSLSTAKLNAAFGFLFVICYVME